MGTFLDFVYDSVSSPQVHLRLGYSGCTLGHCEKVSGLPFLRSLWFWV